MLGGAGVFGSHLVTGLLAHTDFDVVVAGRDAARLAGFTARCSIGSEHRVGIRVLDARDVSSEALRETGAWIVVDAAGPYQAGDYRVARAAIAAGLAYIDLADGRSFVAGFSMLDAAARAAGVVALTGASSTPALSSAALDRLTAGWRHVDQVDVAISPGNRAPRGLSVMRSILSYAGRPVRVFTDGSWHQRPGWGMTVRRTMPGLGRRFLSLAETPDLDVIPARFAVRRAAVFRAGLELPGLHLGLLAATVLVRLGVVRSLAPLARPFRFLAGVFQSFGGDRGGMTVEALGTDADGRAVRGIWSLVADAGDGPVIPTLPALAAIRALAACRFVATGARACVGVLTLANIEAEFRPYRITSRIRFEAAPESLYEAVLGPAFLRLPAPLRCFHQPGWGLAASGMAQVEGATGWLARAAAVAFGFPPAGEVAVTIDISVSDGEERWTRDFGGRRFVSTLSAAAVPGRLVERFGPFAFELDLLISAAGVLGMPVRAWRLGPFPLPHVLAPVSLATEDLDEFDRFRFDVELRLPFGLGRLVRYRGWLIRKIVTAQVGRWDLPLTGHGPM